MGGCFAPPFFFSSVRTGATKKSLSKESKKLGQPPEVIREAKQLLLNPHPNSDTVAAINAKPDRCRIPA
jgi:hypothetical protein